ncbi:hypothetical protein A5784_13610 [Mycobacterium sp. 852013-50091_SCH5140682]|uniref:hypothetical protein n=1 Tax=Mycobacterium sp. 852013-50091_SCH5140682 TaxID=1834109 RepID=UPI0007EB8CF7|nr:hypothetical protein [Mycobacterium sp. 852013-50091_SCH5140682]OBC04588.1 hypothetical protein A5784_13610 [Mycobacterium sp. 852013-50091_SCH5140682]
MPIARLGEPNMASTNHIPDAALRDLHHVHTEDTRIECAWNYVAVGTGHPDGIAIWRRFAAALERY